MSIDKGCPQHRQWREIDDPKNNAELILRLRALTVASLPEIARILEEKFKETGTELVRLADSQEKTSLHALWTELGLADDLAELCERRDNKFRRIITHPYNKDYALARQIHLGNPSLERLASHTNLLVQNCLAQWCQEMAKAPDAKFIEFTKLSLAWLDEGGLDANPVTKPTDLLSRGFGTAITTIFHLINLLGAKYREDQTLKKLRPEDFWEIVKSEKTYHFVKKLAALHIFYFSQLEEHLRLKDFTIADGEILLSDELIAKVQADASQQIREVTGFNRSLKSSTRCPHENPIAISPYAAKTGCPALFAQPDVIRILWSYAIALCEAHQVPQSIWWADPSI